MDKENLPSNLEPVVVTAASSQHPSLHVPNSISMEQLAASTRARFAIVAPDDVDDSREISAQG